MRSPFGIRSGIARWHEERAARGGDRASQELLDIPYVRLWVEDGIWDDRIPTGDAWVAYVGWILEGSWDDSAPTDTLTNPVAWDNPDATPYTIWDDNEATV